MGEKSCEVRKLGQQKKPGCCSIILIVALFVFGAMYVMAEKDSIVRSLGHAAEDIASVPVDESQIDLIEQETDQFWTVPEDAEVITDADATLPPYEAELVEKGDHIINILLIGEDRRENESRARSDSMILCTINTRDKTLVMTSFLRDLYVRIPEWEGKPRLDNRLNVCYAYGGAEMLNEALKQNFGVQVDYNIAVDMEGLKNIICYLDGIDVCLTREEAIYLGHGLVEGMNRLDAELALEFARLRKIDSDFGRTDRQRRLLKGIYSYVKDMNYVQLMGLAAKLDNWVTTDMSNNEKVIFIDRIKDILSELTITGQCIPAAGTYQDVYIREMAVLLPDLDANNAILKETLE